ncbi:MAG: hypothetical protein H6658_05570 [Ardenticatenaceae bacterium]|nr:hypothetical protein [Ardenticatenaceae bacterium]
MSNLLTITLLGSPQIVLNGRSLHFRSVKAIALLAYLATSGTLHSRGELAALLWPESDHKRARGALRYTLSLLKKELGDEFLITNRRQIGLNPQADWTADIVTMRRLLALQTSEVLKTSEVSTIEQAVTLYQANFLQGFTLRDSEPFNEWAFIQAETLRRDLAIALKRLVAHYQTQQQWAAAINHAHRWLNLDPLHEPAHCQLMQLYASAGEWTAVHNQYQSLTDLLQAELHTAPQPETTQLYQRLQQQRPAQPHSSPQRTPAQRSRHVLIEKMDRFWVHSLLTPLHEAQNYIQLRLQNHNSLIDHPWADVLDTDSPPTAVTIQQAFHNADHALLIIGAPGAGKTISLIELAQSLLTRARQDENQPVPVILNLSGWAEKQLPLDQWVVEEMVAKYQIPRRQGRQWLAGDKLLFLLDGLDEMPPTERAESIAAINTFRQKHGLADLVVCCRQEAYETAVTHHNIRLQLNGAVRIRPLTTGQIRQHTPPHLVAALFQDELLLEMAQSPLNLNLLQTVFSHPTNGRSPITHHNLFQQYVQHMIQRQQEKESLVYDDTYLNQQLSWLAQQMQQHNHALFLIEQLQPSWLANGRQQWLYLLLSHTLMPATTGTLILWSFIQLISGNPPYIRVHFLSQIAAGLSLTPSPWNQLLSLFFLTLFAGILSTFVTGLFFRWRQKRGDGARLDKRLGWLQILLVGSVAATAVTLPISLTDEFGLAAFLGSMTAFGSVLTFGGLNYGQSFATEIRLRGALQWHWRRAFLLGAIGGFLSLVWSGIIWLREPTAVAWQLNLLNTSMYFFLLGGLSGRQAEAKNRPNEGIRIAARNGLMAMLVIAVPVIGVTAVTVNAFSGWYTGLMLGILAGIMHGFNDVIKHTIVRLLLWRSQHIPLNYPHLLDTAAACTLLQKVGGGYTFRHRLLQDYFANDAANKNGRSTPPHSAQPATTTANSPTPTA